MHLLKQFRGLFLVPGVGNKIIRDVVHGYITLNEQDLKIVDTPHFQRLKRIRQTCANSVYPSVNHTRFEHSLGVMYLGIKVMKQLGIPSNKVLFNTLKYACLLHDIGHAPLSHLGENFYKKSELISLLKDRLTKIVSGTAIEGENAAKHEICSCIIALDYFNKKLEDCDVNLDLFCRMILGEKYDTPEKYIENCLISILNSSADVDKLDYILRDCFMSGTQLVSIDTDRIISAYTIDNNFLVFSSKAISTLSNFIFGRNALYTWIYNHHITVYTDNVFKRLIKHLLLKTPEDRNELFSYEAVSEKLTDDYDLINFIRKYKDTDDFSLSLYEQLFNRKYYKALWKTVFDFESKISDSANRDYFIKAAGQFRGEEGGLEKLEERIIKASDDKLIFNEFFIATASFKPYIPDVGEHIYILIGGQRRRYDQIFTSSVYQNVFKMIPYVFVKNEESKQILLEVLNEGNY